MTGDDDATAAPITVLRSGRLRLRPPHDADLVALVALRRDEAVRRYLGGVVSEAEAHAKARSVVGSPDHFVVEIHDTDEFVGLVSLCARGDDVELSYELSSAHWGKGYAYEVCATLLASPKATRAERPIVAITQRANERSKSLLRRLGFTDREEFTEFGAVQVLFAQSSAGRG